MVSFWHANLCVGMCSKSPEMQDIFHSSCMWKKISEFILLNAVSVFGHPGTTRAVVLPVRSIYMMHIPFLTSGKWI